MRRVLLGAFLAGGLLGLLSSLYHAPATIEKACTVVVLPEVTK